MPALFDDPVVEDAAVTPAAGKALFDDPVLQESAPPSQAPPSPVQTPWVQPQPPVSPRAAMAEQMLANPNAAGDTWDAVNTPLTKILPENVRTLARKASLGGAIELMGKAIPGAAGKVVTGLGEGTEDVGESFTSPLAIATVTLKAPKAIQAILAAAFGIMGIKQVGESGVALKDAVKQGDWQKAGRLATEILGGASQVALGAHGFKEGVLDTVNQIRATEPTTKGTANEIQQNVGQESGSGADKQVGQSGQQGPSADVKTAPDAPSGEIPVNQTSPNAIPERPAVSSAVPAQTAVTTEATPISAEAAQEVPLSAGVLGNVGMGAAKPGEFGTPGEGTVGHGRDIYGIADRVRQARAEQEQVAPVAPGQGIGAQESVEHGRDLLDKGADPQAVMSEFEKTKRFNADDIAIARAQGEKLAKAARDIESEHGTESPEYQKAFDELSAWDARSKVMQTEWHKQGMAQQGETDIDTGTFTGLQRAFKDDTGKEFNPKQARTAKAVAEKVTEADKAADTAKKNLNEHLQDETKAAQKIDEDAKARKAALAAAYKTVRDAAKRLADAEEKKKMAQAVADKKAAELERKTAAKALAAAEKARRDAAVKAAQAEQKNAANPEIKVWAKAREYLDQGADDFDEVRNKVATDLGMPVSKVTDLLTRNKRAKFLADDAWRKQQNARRFKNHASQWLKQTAIPPIQRALSNVPKYLFGAKVGFHGTVALGTHAPMVAFQPRFWKAYVQDFGKMYKMVKSPAYYEMQVQDLQRRPNYITARRAGLVNDPHVYEDFSSPDTAKYFGNLTGMGNRGYSVLKILRQDMFDQMWNKLPKTAQVSEVAKAIADGVNHATGVVQARAPKGASVAVFAPRLEMSRGAWLYTDPIRAVKAFENWKEAPEGEKHFAINQIKEKAWVVGTMLSMLALNQGFLAATKSKQEINFTDPMKSDWLKFKAAGMDVSYGNAMLNLIRLPMRLLAIRNSDGGKLKNMVFPDESSYSTLGEYGRSQESPSAKLATDFWMKADWQNRPLPNSSRPVPKRLKAQGVEPYTWGEYLTEAALPIPAEEAVRDVWKTGLGMSPEQQKQALKAMLTATFMAGTGARMEDDTRPNQ